MGIAIAKFKAKAAATSKSTEPTESQAESKRMAAARNRLLVNAPEHVKQKWAVLGGLKWRDRNKAAQKTKHADALRRQNV